MTDFATMSFPALGEADDAAASDEARRRGYARGLAQGLRAGEAAAAANAERLRLDEQQQAAAATARLRSAESALGRAAAELDARTAAVVSTNDRVLIEAALSLAEAIVGVELRDPAFAATAALTRVLAVAEARELVRIRLNPDDLTAIEAPAGVELLPDASVARGDAIAETAHGSIDATVAGALGRARAALDALGQKTAAREAVRS